jgi:hypothetical protein
MQTVRFILMTLAVLVITSVGYAQNNFWLQGIWRGKAYLPGSDGSQYYLLVMSISEIKGNKFEGIIATMQPTDTSYRFDSKISGIVYDKYLIINRTRILYVKDAPDIKWKVSCNNCKPPRMSFTIENGKIFFRGEEKDCYKECNGVSEFSKDITEFDSSKKEAVYALVNYVAPPQADTASLVKNTVSVSTHTVAASSPENISAQRIPALPAGTIVSTSLVNVNSSLRKETASLKNNISLTIRENPPPRISILPEGEIVAAKHDNINTLPGKESVTLHNNISLMIAENPPPKISILPPGDIVMAKHNNVNTLSEKETAALRNNISLMIKENPAPRISILPPGNIVGIKHNNITTLSEKETVTLHNNISLMIKENPPPRISILPAGDIVITKPQAALSFDKKIGHPLRNIPLLTVQQNIPLVVTKSSSPDSLASNTKASDTTKQKIIAIALPEDYAARKKNVIRTLTVNTDSIVLRVYDNGVVDGDIVSVIYNDIVVIDKLSLTTRAVVVKIPVNPSQTNTLVFHAHNLGEFPPNTAKLEILYGNKKEELTVSSDLTVSSTIDIVHQ